MHDNLTTKQVQFIQDLLQKQWQLRYHSYAVWVMPILLAFIELMMHLFVSDERSIVFSVISVVGFAIFYRHLRKSSRQRILDTVRKSLFTTESGQAVSVYKERHPGAFHYIYNELNAEFGMNLQS